MILHIIRFWIDLVHYVILGGWERKGVVVGKGVAGDRNRLRFKYRFMVFIRELPRNLEIFLFHFEELIAVRSCELLEFSGLDLPVVEEAFGMFVFEVEIKGGITKIDFIAIALISWSFEVETRVSSFLFFFFIDLIRVFVEVAAHFLVIEKIIL